MHRLGLALSGGGFRATLYHLGAVRFLRDAKILPKITHITSVSGGSILGAHLALNWDRYCGSPDEFDEAAGEIIRFVQLDVRNRIVRRFPFASTANLVRRLIRMQPVRRLTRPGLLEQHYTRFLYGDIPLSDLPDRPRLHILTTNLSEGCLCSFNQNGLLLLRRSLGRRDRFEKVHMGLATVPMAVTASSAFPGFFPPLQVNGSDVGADEGEFSRHAFTDGGIYDNLGLRMFRCLEQSWASDAAPLHRDDILELEDVTLALASASSLPEQTPLRRLREMLDLHEHVTHEHFGKADDPADAVLHGLWEIIRSERLYRDACFQNIELSEPSAQSLLSYLVELGREPELDDRLWLNRHIVESALRQVIGKPCLRLNRKGLDGILVSDAGGRLKVREIRGGSLISTAIRSSDILMNRVWQLESEAFENTQGVLCFPISDVVDQSQDRSAPYAEIQHQVARIRTDLDRFSDLEISTLVRHGYCVARNACRTKNDILKTAIPSGAPWDPLDTKPSEKGPEPPPQSDKRESTTALRTARRLSKSSRRRVWSTLASVRDWPTYVWVCLVICLAVSLPYSAYNLNKRVQRQKMVLTGIAEMSPNYRQLLDLLDHGHTSTFQAMPFSDVESLEEPDYTGFEVLSDTRIFDLRGWSDSTGATPAMSYVRLHVRRTPEGSERSHLRLQRETIDEDTAWFCETQSLNPSLSRMRAEDGSYLWELDLDFSHVPIDGRAEVVLQRTLTSEMASESADQGRFNFTTRAKTGLLQVWMLLPEGRDYESFEVSGYPVGKPEMAQIVVPHSTAHVALGSVATFRLINPEEDYRYECRWTWSGTREQE